jgi:hypothetical protein
VKDGRGHKSHPEGPLCKYGSSKVPSYHQRAEKHCRKVLWIGLRPQHWEGPHPSARSTPFPAPRYSQTHQPLPCVPMDGGKGHLILISFYFSIHIEKCIITSAGLCETSHRTFLSPAPKEASHMGRVEFVDTQTLICTLSLCPQQPGTSIYSHSTDLETKAPYLPSYVTALSPRGPTWIVILDTDGLPSSIFLLPSNGQDLGTKSTTNASEGKRQSQGHQLLSTRASQCSCSAWSPTFLKRQKSESQGKGDESRWPCRLGSILTCVSACNGYAK